MKPSSIFAKPIRFEFVMLALSVIIEGGVDALFNETSNSLSYFANPITHYLDEVRDDKREMFKRHAFVLSAIFPIAAKIACIKKVPLYFPEFDIRSIEQWMSDNLK